MIIKTICEPNLVKSRHSLNMPQDQYDVIFDIRSKKSDAYMLLLIEFWEICVKFKSFPFFQRYILDLASQLDVRHMLFECGQVD